MACFFLGSAEYFKCWLSHCLACWVNKSHCVIKNVCVGLPLAHVELFESTLCGANKHFDKSQKQGHCHRHIPKYFTTLSSTPQVNTFNYEFRFWHFIVISIIQSESSSHNQEETCTTTHHVHIRHIQVMSFLLEKSTTVLLLSHTASPRGMFFLFMTQPLGAYHTASILQGFKHQEAPIQSLHHQEVHQTYNTGCNMDNDHRYGSLFTLMHAEYRVDIGYFMKNCKFASRVRMKNGTTKLLTIEE